jgi:hypothetical protein
VRLIRQHNVSNIFEIKACFKNDGTKRYEQKILTMLDKLLENILRKVFCKIFHFDHSKSVKPTNFRNSGKITPKKKRFMLKISQLKYLKKIK